LQYSNIRLADNSWKRFPQTMFQRQIIVNPVRPNHADKRTVYGQQYTSCFVFLYGGCWTSVYFFHFIIVDWLILVLWVCCRWLSMESGCLGQTTQVEDWTKAEKKTTTKRCRRS